MGKFINPFTDVGFKRIFGQDMSKPVLIAFLNSLLTGERKIKDVSFLDKEQLGHSDIDRSLIYDIYCETADGSHIIVEMQNKYQPYFKNRSIYYLSRSVSQQGERGAEWLYDIKAVYLIAFLNFRLDDISKRFRTDVALADIDTKAIFSNKLRLIYLQLPYFTKEADECINVFERFIYVLKNMDILTRMPWAAQDSVFQKLASIAEVSALDRKERQLYDESLRKYRDTLVVMEGQFQEGMEQGIANVARAMKANNMPLEQISLYTGLTTEEISQL
ncbi:MAG: PD-(D/E)XK nuclease family transposase [Bacteroidaceae bacterium]|nr:PD-(D/E)XK nuclease family transposase [Bacteroidaceae bacterium]